MIVCFTSIFSYGGHFMDWSFNYLTGRELFRSCKEWLPLVSSPLGGAIDNAHLHKANHPGTLVEWTDVVNDLIKEDDSKICTFYGGTRGGISKGILRQDYLTGLNLALDKGIKIIFIHNKFEWCRYFLRREHKIENHPDINVRNSALRDRIREEFSTVNNLESQIIDNGHMRNFLFLSHKKLMSLPELEEYSSVLPLEHKNFLPLDHSLWITQGPQAIKIIFDWVGLEINEDRLSLWHDIYRQWSTPLRRKIDLIENIDKILSSIINGESHDIGQYDLDVFWESWIQYRLVTDHSAVLRCDGLEQFPKNTKDLTPFLKKNGPLINIKFKKI